MSATYTLQLGNAAATYTIATGGRGPAGPGGISDLTGLIVQGDNITLTGTGTAADPFIINATGELAATVAWGDVTEKPAWTATFDGSYGSLTGLPTLFDGAYSSLSGIPATFAPDLTGVTPASIGAATSAQGTSADTAFSWGDHALAGYLLSAPVTSVAGRTGVVTLSTSDISGLGNSATLNTGTTAGTVALGNHTHAQLHDRSHAMNDSDNHVAGDWKLFYSSGLGEVVELALGADDTYLKSNGPAAIPSFEAVAATGGGPTFAGEAVTNVLAGSNITFSIVGGVVTLNVSAGSATIGDGTYGDIVVTGTGTIWTIGNGAVTLAKMANMATASLIYRKAAGAGPPEVNTLATLKTDLGLTGTNTGDQDLTGYQLQPTEGPFVNGDKTKLDALPALAVENLIGTTSGGIVTTLVNAGEHVVLDVGGIVLDSSTGGIDCGTIKSFEYDFASTTLYNYTTATAAAHRLAMGASTLAETVINESDNEVALIVATHAFNYLVLQAAAGVELRLDPGLSWPGDCIIYIRRDSACGPITFSTAGNFIAPTGNAVDDIAQNGTFAIRRRGNTSNWDFI